VSGPESLLPEVPKFPNQDDGPLGVIPHTAAFVDVQLIVAEDPEVMLTGPSEPFAFMSTDGGPGSELTVSVALHVVVPPGPVTTSGVMNVPPPASQSEDCEPLVATLPPLRVALVAFVEVQL